LAPLASNLSAMANPIPRTPPVTTAVLPTRSILFINAPSHVVGNKVEEEGDGCKDELENKCANQCMPLKR
jgi:hypothetical protein